MTNAQGAIVRPVFGETDPTNTPHSERVRNLHAETLEVTRAHIAELAAALQRMTVLADEIAAGGPSYPVVVRDVARRLGQEAPVASRTLSAALARF